jgi:molybdopterin molybdotransferase
MHPMRDDRTQGLQTIAQFTPLTDALARLAGRVGRVATQRIEAAAALGCTLAEDIAIDVCRPPAAIALRDGWAVKSELTADASPYAPAPIPMATWMEAGDALSPEQDAVLPIDATSARAGLVQAVAPVAAGDGVLPAGGDLPRNARTLPAGRRLNRVQLALLQTAGIENVCVRIPRLRLARARNTADWIIDTALACIADAVHCKGAMVLTSHPDQHFEQAFADPGSDAIVVIGGSGSGRADRVVRTLASIGELVVHGIGLVPGETAAFGLIESRPVLVVPGRLDAALAAWHMLGHAMLEKLAGSTEPLVSAAARLTHKVASAGGIAELVPVRCEGGAATPLGSGYLPAAILAQANGWILIAPESEGYPVNSEVAVRRWP